MNRRKYLLSALSLLCLAGGAMAEPDLTLADVPEAKKVGAGRLVYFFMPIFDAVLYAPDGHYRPDQPFALSLTYLRSLNGSDIAHSGVDEIRAQGGVSPDRLRDWGKQMAVIFPDVSAGTCLTGVYDAHGATTFYQADRKLGRIDDPEFGKHFFAIWLGDKSSQPALRTQLLGGA